MQEYVKCAHCNGTGSTRHHCCASSSGVKSDGRSCAGYSPHRCCACKGRGVQPVY